MPQDRPDRNEQIDQTPEDEIVSRAGVEEDFEDDEEMEDDEEVMEGDEQPGGEIGKK